MYRVYFYDRVSAKIVENRVHSDGEDINLSRFILNKGILGISHGM